jgi:putative hemin transport protein
MQQAIELRTPDRMTDPEDMWQRWQELKAGRAGLRARDAAAELGVSEAELVASGEGRVSERLEPGDWGTFLEDVGALGPVMALTRNEHAVHEKTGTYRKIDCGPAMGLVLDEDIDLRLFFRQWRHLFAVGEDSHGRRRWSFQVFDGAGTAVHKIFLTQHSDEVAFERLVTRRSPSRLPARLEVETPPPSPAVRPDAEIDIRGLRDGWDALQDTHDFFGLLKRFDVSRTQGLRLAGPERARPVAADALRRVLHGAAGTGLPVMVFVGNRGCIQIHTGEVRTLKAMGPWFNVLDPGFNLHLREDRIAEAWVVAKPTRDGAVTSLELFDAAGEAIATLFGRRKPGEAELPAWRALLAELPAAGRPA